MEAMKTMILQQIETLEQQHEMVVQSANREIRVITNAIARLHAVLAAMEAHHETLDKPADSVFPQSGE